MSAPAAFLRLLFCRSRNSRHSPRRGSARPHPSSGRRRRPPTRLASFSENGSGVVTSTSFEPCTAMPLAGAPACSTSAPAPARDAACRRNARQHRVARRRNLQHLQKAREVFRHLEQADGVAHGRGVNQDLVVVGSSSSSIASNAPLRPFPAGWCRAAAPVRRG